ncbi:MAG: hypothetical protein WBO70_04850, partial [Erysipelotrichaceae bacterium]
LAVKNLTIPSLQSDYKILTIFNQLHLNYQIKEKMIVVKPSSINEEHLIDIGECCDLGPILCLLGLITTKPITLINTKRLQYKESNRLNVMKAELHKINCPIEVQENKTIIYPFNIIINDKYIDSNNDHRIYMAFAIINTILNDQLVISDPHSVNKSFPNFHMIIKKLSQ